MRAASLIEREGEAKAREVAYIRPEVNRSSYGQVEL